MERETDLEAQPRSIGGAPARPRAGEAGGDHPGWLRFHQRKSEVHRRHATVWSIPVRRKTSHLLRGLLRPGARVLDVGAGGRSWEPKVRAAAPDVTYRSLDQDRRTRQDYYSLDDVEGSYDLVLLVEVIEHLSFEDGVEFLGRLRSFLAPGGRLLLTTPNAAHATRWWQDPTHRTAWPYDWLEAALLEHGYGDLRAFRLYHAKVVTFLFMRALGWIPYRLLGLDHARTLAIIAARDGR